MYAHVKRAGSVGALLALVIASSLLLPIAAQAVQADGPLAALAVVDTTPPTVQINKPASGDTVSGTVSVEVKARDDVQLAKVDLSIDGTLRTTQTTTQANLKFAFSWNTSDLFGSHTLSARAVDAIGNAASTSITVTVSGVAAAPVLSGLTLNPASVVGGNSSTGTVSLSAAAPAATTVALASSSAEATVPASVTIPAGASTASFTVTTTAVNATTAVTISASSGGVTVSATLTLTPPAAPGAPTLSGLTLNPTSVVGGTSSTGTVTLSAVAAAATNVALSTSNLNVAGVPASVTVAAGSTSASFTVTTAGAVSASTNVTITASLGGVSRSAVLTVTGSPLAISTAGLTCTNGVCELGPGNVGTFFAQSISSSGGTGPTPFSWNMVAGRLPDKLTLNDPRQCGVHCVTISGTPTTVQTTTFTIEVQDSAGATAQHAFSITINPPRPLVVTTPSNCCPPGTVGASYAIQLFADGGVQPYGWAPVTGQLPPGLTLSGTGRISGTPTTSGTFSFTVRVTDNAGAQATGGPFSIAVSP